METTIVYIGGHSGVGISPSHALGTSEGSNMDEQGV